MPRLSFGLGFRSTEMNGLELPIEIRKLNNALVGRTRSTEPVDLDPGSYYVTARLPAGQSMTRSIELRDTDERVLLQPDPEDEWDHEWDEERHFLDAVRSSGGGSWAEWTESGASRRAASTLESDPIGIGAGETALQPDRAYLRVFSGNLLRGPAKKEAPGVALIPQEHDAKRIAYFRLPEGPRVVQLLEVGVPALNLVAPARTRIAVSRRRSSDRRGGAFKMEAFLESAEASLLLRYCRQGAYLRAGAAAQSERLLSDKIEDPVAAAVGAYALLKIGDIERMHDWTANLERLFPWLPDGCAVHGEHLARLGRHGAALAAFLRLPERGLPIVADGLFYAIERAKTYSQLPADRSADVDVAGARTLLEQLQPHASLVHRQRPLTSFPGLEPSQPEVALLKPGQPVDEVLEIAILG